MIQKLKSADLGFYVQATETQEKLGKLVGTWEALLILPTFVFHSLRQDPTTSVGLSSA